MQETMPKNKKTGYLAEYAYVRPSRKGARVSKKLPHRLFFMAITLTAIAILVFFANIFSGIITPGRIHLNRGDKYANEHYLYAVELANFTDVGQANEISKTYKQQLAAGYVLNDSGTYRVLASMYQTKVSADSVLKNLKESNIEASIYEIKLSPLYMTLNLEKAQKDALKQVLNMWYNTYVNLYNLSIALDKAEKTIDQTKIEVLNLKTSVENEVINFNTKITLPRTTPIIYTKIYLNMLTEKLNALANEDTSSSLYSSALKETYFQIISDYLSLKTELAKN